MRLRDLLDPPALGLELLVGTEQLDREIRWVVTTDLLEPGRYLTGRELVLTGLVWRKGPEDSEHFVAALADAGASGLAAGDAAGGEEGGVIPDDLVRACRRHQLPLFRVPSNLAFATVTEHLARRLSAQRAGDIGSVLERHSRLVSASAAGQALDPILELIAQDLGLACWVITSTGRAVAGSQGELEEDDRIRLARCAVRAARFPETVTIGAGKARRRSVFALGGVSRLIDWYLVFDGEVRKWEPQHQSLATKVAAVLAVERARLEERDEPVRRLGEELVRLIAEGGAEPDILARMRLTGLDPGGSFQAVSLAVVAAGVPGSVAGSRTGGLPGSRAGSGAGAASATLLRFLLEDIGVPHSAIAELHDHAVALVSADDAVAAEGIAGTGTSGTATAAPASATAGTGASAATSGTGTSGTGTGTGTGTSGTGTGTGVAMSGTGTSGAGTGTGPGSVAVGAPGIGANGADATAESIAGTGSTSHEHSEQADSSDRSLADRLRVTLLDLAPGLGRDRVAIGVSDRRAGARGLADAVEEAGHALAMSRSQPDQVSVFAHQELASHLLLLAAVPDDIRLAYRDRLLAPLRAYDAAHRSDLEATLESFLACSTSWTRCAELMHVHVNTLRYRIARIEELTGRDLADLETQVDLFLALRLRRLGGSHESGPT